MYRPPDPVKEPLYVIVPIVNPVRFKSRWKLYQRFAKMVQCAGGVLVTIEAAFGRREHALQGVAPEGLMDTHVEKIADYRINDGGARHIYIKVRTSHEIWIKENLINIAMQNLPCDWKYVAWVDGDIAFARPNWVGETIHQLQHYAFVQMFSYAQDLGPTYEPSLKHRSFMDCYIEDVKDDRTPPGGYYYYETPSKGPIFWHPGYAWAARRDAIDAVGGLIEIGILGAGDNHMAHALIGQVRKSVHPAMHPEYIAVLDQWQARAERYIRRNVGVMKGLLLHYWHGKKRDRKYRNRWQILVKYKFNPATDLKKDSQGLLQISDLGDIRTVRLRDAIRAYFRQRNEDSIDE